MGLSPALGRLLFLLWLPRICSGFVNMENCTNYRLQFERVFSVPGDVAMLNSTLVSLEVFDFRTIPYNITWYKTGQEISNSSSQILVLKETLWFLNITLADAGEYVTVLRTPSRCYMQSTKLVVELPAAGECGRPRKAFQTLTNEAWETLSCPLQDYIDKLDSYNITSTTKWYKGCDPIFVETDETDIYSYRERTKLTVKKVGFENSGDYTCTLTFILGGVAGSVSETIEATVRDEYNYVPQVHKPANVTIKAEIGSNFTKKCLVFVPGIGMPFVDVCWWVKGQFIYNMDPSERIYTSEQGSWSENANSTKKGMWLERSLTISELKAEDFNLNYTCRAHSSRGIPEGYFTLLPADPNPMAPIGSVFGIMTVLFVISVTIYYTFRIDIVLWVRRAFPVFYKNKDLDGKLYDAYVAYPQPYALGFSEEVEKFALHTLPQVLEKTCDYKLFIAGRDCLAGQAMVDSVEENIEASRRFLLLYNASTFTSKRHTSSTGSNNNNISKNSDGSDKIESNRDSSMSLDGSGNVYTDTRQQLECVAAMHRALLEGSLKVVLVELEEITPAQLALFPESVRHLRKKQGAVCWWKNFRTSRQRWRTCTKSGEDEERGQKDSQPSSSLSPSSRFWKEMRYHMPVRGKRTVYPEKTALLNLR
ncbi:interleukin-1 receptor type 1-like isoform 1-T3 [Odontesthes bonariensis]|uniref:interleukin-1 receptor type 1-like n=1 Tax=Odontesthes bonariensis TaxID=219752 RepID=UPI003F58D913